MIGRQIRTARTITFVIALFTLFTVTCSVLFVITQSTGVNTNTVSKRVNLGMTLEEVENALGLKRDTLSSKVETGYSGSKHVIIREVNSCFFFLPQDQIVLLLTDDEKVRACYVKHTWCIYEKSEDVDLKNRDDNENVLEENLKNKLLYRKNVRVEIKKNAITTTRSPISTWSEHRCEQVAVFFLREL
jgi:hypothetical protein